MNRPSTFHERLRAADMHKSGMSLRAIGAALNRSVHAVHRWINPEVAEWKRAYDRATRPATGRKRLPHPEQARLIERMLSGEPFTQGQIVADHGQRVLVAHTIQKLRREGKIAFARQGRAVVWNVTGEKQ